MNQRTLFVLAVLAFLVISAAWILQPRQTYEPDGAAEIFLPGLLEQANDLNSLGLYTAGGVLIGQFSRVNDSWISASPAGYPADWDNIRNLVARLAEAKIKEHKTANLDYYERLGVRDVSDQEAAGIRVELASETTRWVAILGYLAGSRQGQYARIPEEAVSVLLDQELELSRDPVGWLEQEIVDLPAAHVQSVSIQHPGDPVINIRKTSDEDTDYMLQDVPDKRAARIGFTINGIASGLASLEMQEVRPADAINFSGAITTRFDCFDGRGVSADLVQMDNKWWLRISAEYIPSESQPEDAPSEETGTLDWVEAVNSRKSAWAFAIPEYKYDALTRELEDLLEAVEE